MRTTFSRGPYGSLSFVRTGCTVHAFHADESRILTGWCLRIGATVYDGFPTRRAAIEAVGRYI